MSETMTSTEKVKQLVPQLRFAEFDGSWNLKELSKVITFISGYAFKSSEMKRDSGIYQLIKMSNVYKSKLQLDRNPSFWDEIDERQANFLLKKQDILLTLTGTVGKKDYGYSVVIPEDNKFLLNQRLVCLRAIPKISDSNFIDNLVKTSRFFYHFFSESKGGTGNQSNVGIVDLKSIKLFIPSLPEQQKIATFLSAVDKKIAQLTRKKALLEQYKKGVMQQLFSRQLRFKDEQGRAFPEWEEKRLGEVAKVTTGSTPKTSISEYYNGNRLFVSPTDLGENRFVKKTKTTLTELGFSKGRKISKGSVLFVCIGSTIGKVGLAGEECLTNQQINALTGIDGNLNGFIYLVLEKNAGRIKLLAGVQAVPQINKTDFSNFKFEFPSIPEQQKIAECISAIDKKIDNVTNQITKSQAFKKGLLQQLFV